MSWKLGWKIPVELRNRRTWSWHSADWIIRLQTQPPRMFFYSITTVFFQNTMNTIRTVSTFKTFNYLVAVGYIFDLNAWPWTGRSFLLYEHEFTNAQRRNSGLLSSRMCFGEAAKPATYNFRLPHPGSGHPLAPTILGLPRKTSSQLGIGSTRSYDGNFICFFYNVFPNLNNIAIVLTACWAHPK